MTPFDDWWLACAAPHRAKPSRFGVRHLWLGGATTPNPERTPLRSQPKVPDSVSTSTRTQPTRAALSPDPLALRHLHTHSLAPIFHPTPHASSLTNMSSRREHFDPLTLAAFDTAIREYGVRLLLRGAVLRRFTLRGLFSAPRRRRLTPFGNCGIACDCELGRYLDDTFRRLVARLRCSPPRKAKSVRCPAPLAGRRNDSKSRAHSTPLPAKGA